MEENQNILAHGNSDRPYIAMHDLSVGFPRASSTCADIGFTMVLHILPTASLDHMLSSMPFISTIWIIVSSASSVKSTTLRHSLIIMLSRSNQSHLRFLILSKTSLLFIGYSK